MTTQTIETGGLVGMAARLKSGTARALRASYENLGAALVGMFVVFVVGAAVLSILESTLAKSGTTLTLSRLLLLGLGAIIAELMGIHRLVLAWHAAKPGQMAAWSAVWVIGLGFSVYSAVNSSAEFSSKRANIQKAAHQKSENVSQNLKDARDKLRQEEKNVKDLKAMTWQAMPTVDGKTVMSAEAARALIQTYEGNTRFYVDLTNRCTDAKGPNARKFCKDLGDARAAEKDLTERASWNAKIKEAEATRDKAAAAFDAAQNTEQTTDVQTSDSTPFVSLVSYFTGAEPEKVMWIETFQISFTNMLLVSLAGLVLGLHHASQTPRTRWFRMSGQIKSARRWVKAALYGAPSADDELKATLARDGKIEINQSLEDNRHLPEAAKLIADLTAKYRPATA